MTDIIDKVYHGYNNYYDLKNKFYDFLTQELRNEPNKVEFLKKLIDSLELKYFEEQKTCNKENCECKLELKENAIKIINSKINEIENDNIPKDVVNVDNSVNKNVVTSLGDIVINQNSNNNNNNNNTEHKEKWFNKNIKLIYYTGGVIALFYSLYKWVYPLF